MAGSDPTSSPLRRVLRDPRVLVAAAVGVTVRLLVIALDTDLRLVGDEIAHIEGGRAILAGEPVASFPFRPPLYTYFCALVLKLSPSASAIRIAQSILEGITILGIAAIGLEAIGRGASRWAAWIYALYPDFIAYSHYLWSESLFLLLLVLGLLWLQRLWHRPSPLVALGTGLSWGAIALVKVFNIYILPAALGFFVWKGYGQGDGTRRAGLAALVVLSAVAVTVPWSVKVSLETGRSIYVATVGEANIRNGTNVFEPPQFDYPNKVRVPKEVRKQIGRTEGLVPFVLSNPGLFATRAFEKMTHLWSPNSYLIRHMYRRQKYTGLGEASRAVIACITMLSTALLLAGAAFGVFVVRDRFLLEVGGTYTVLYTAMLTITPVLSRYRLPLMVFAILAFSALLVRRKDVAAELRKPWVAGSISTALAILAVLSAVDLWELLPALF